MQSIFDVLVNIVHTQHQSYIFECSSNAKKLHYNFALLMAHPQQRPQQSEFRATLLQDAPTPSAAGVPSQPGSSSTATVQLGSSSTAPSRCQVQGQVQGSGSTAVVGASLDEVRNTFLSAFFTFDLLLPHRVLPTRTCDHFHFGGNPFGCQLTGRGEIGWVANPLPHAHPWLPPCKSFVPAMYAYALCLI